ncbi:hypothetical protein Moror_9163 [Moniliophthora roreri MCA 2997]|uniref:Uncharacterized protein n=1 Tax=Moniliophthora roreri (strain MCA 2997) TaxID=1381753 RepID=V2WJY8_MONRO|nr:hypothetical protein Moror_9163 [Moniliophthora roreri MCA 2997]
MFTHLKGALGETGHGLVMQDRADEIVPSTPIANAHDKVKKTLPWYPQLAILLHGNLVYDQKDVTNSTSDLDLSKLRHRKDQSDGQGPFAGSWDDNNINGDGDSDSDGGGGGDGDSNGNKSDGEGNNAAEKENNIPQRESPEWDEAAMEKNLANTNFDSSSQADPMTPASSPSKSQPLSNSQMPNSPQSEKRGTKWKANQVANTIDTSLHSIHQHHDCSRMAIPGKKRAAQDSAYSQA